MYKENYLIAFIERLNFYQEIYQIPFFTLYNDWLTEVSDLLHNEIEDNLLLLAPEKHNKYLEIIKRKIKKNFIFNQSSFNLNKWIEKYDLSKYEFPFFENKEVTKILATSIDQYELDYTTKKIATYMQSDFYCYAAMIEVQKMIAFIDDLITKKYTCELIPKHTKEINPYPRIFTTDKAFNKFKNLREKFGKTPNDMANYSFVYHRMIKDKFIYDDYMQKEFVYFLLDFDINISRIKSKTQLGNYDFRESIYNSLK